MLWRRTYGRRGAWCLGCVLIDVRLSHWSNSLFGNIAAALDWLRPSQRHAHLRRHLPHTSHTLAATLLNLHSYLSDLSCLAHLAANRRARLGPQKSPYIPHNHGRRPGQIPPSRPRLSTPQSAAAKSGHIAHRAREHIDIMAQSEGGATAGGEAHNAGQKEHGCE